MARREIEDLTMKVADWDKRDHVRLAGSEVEVPAWFDMELSHPEWPIGVVVTVSVDSETGPQLTGLRAGRSTAGSYRDAQSLLGEVNLDDLLTSATALAAGFLAAWRAYELIPAGLDEPDRGQVMGVLAQLRRLVADQAYPAARPQQRRRMTRSFLRSVAEVYRAALADGEPPTMTVAQRFHVAHRTAGRWVSQARRIGELGPAVGPTAGELEAGDDG